MQIHEWRIDSSVRLANERKPTIGAGQSREGTVHAADLTIDGWGFALRVELSRAETARLALQLAETAIGNPQATADDLRDVLRAELEARLDAPSPLQSSQRPLPRGDTK